MRFAIVVMDRGRREGWREKFIEELARRGVTLHSDETDLNEIHLRGAGGATRLGGSLCAAASVASSLSDEPGWKRG